MWIKIPSGRGGPDRAEGSHYTSVKEHIEERHEPSPSESPLWLCPIGEESPAGRRGILSMTRDEYLSLIDWTGRVRANPGRCPTIWLPCWSDSKSTNPAGWERYTVTEVFSTGWRDV